jgi:phage baseplate assembly protein W
MANSKIRRYYGIKFPFTTDNQDGIFVDLNKTLDDKVASELLHVILTPKRTRIRMPNFGTDLIKFIFEMGDDNTWSSIKSEIETAVSCYVQNTKLNDIEVLRDTTDETKVFLKITYSVQKGNTTENKVLAVKL